MVDSLSLVIESVAAGEPFGLNRPTRVSIPRILSKFRENGDGSEFSSCELRLKMGTRAARNHAFIQARSASNGKGDAGVPVPNFAAPSQFFS
jgi:hypothetical protein